MEPISFYRLGQIRHQEMIREAENHRIFQSRRAEPSTWRTVFSHLSARLSAFTAFKAASGWRVEPTS